MNKKITDYLGFQVSIMLRDNPFHDWLVERSVEEDLDPPLIHYVFPKRDLELRCDDDEKINVIFLHSKFDESILFEPLFSWDREQLLAYFGDPSKSGDKRSHPILGDYGAWDRFTTPEYTVRFEYKKDSKGIDNITFMRNDVVPQG